MRRAPPHAAMRELGIVEQLADRLHRRGAQTARAQRADRFIARPRACPLRDARVELGLTRAAPVRAPERAVARPRRVAEHLAEARPLVVVPDRERDPAVIALARIHAVRHCHPVVVRVAGRHRTVRRVLEERGPEELETRFVLREIDRAAFAGAAAPLERGEDRDDAVSDRDVVDVRAVEDQRRAAWLAEELVEPGERRELAPVSGMLRMRPGLSLIAAREDDEGRAGATQRVGPEAAAREPAGREGPRPGTRGAPPPP